MKPLLPSLNFILPQDPIGMDSCELASEEDLFCQETVLRVAQSMISPEHVGEYFEAWWSLWKGYHWQAIKSILKIILLMRERIPSEDLLFEVSTAFLRKKMQGSPYIQQHIRIFLQQENEFSGGQELLQKLFYAPPFHQPQFDFLRLPETKIHHPQAPKYFLIFATRSTFLSELEALFKLSLTEQHSYFSVMKKEDLLLFEKSFSNFLLHIDWDKRKIRTLLYLLTEKEKKKALNSQQELIFWRYLVAERSLALFPVFQWGLEHLHHYLDHSEISLLGLLHAGLISGEY